MWSWWSAEEGKVSPPGSLEPLPARRRRRRRLPRNWCYWERYLHIGHRWQHCGDVWRLTILIKFRLIPRLPCSGMQTLKLCRWRLTKPIYDKAVCLKLSKMNPYTFCFLGFFLGDDITSVGSGFITLPRWLCVPSPPGLRGVLLNEGVWSLVGVVTAWPIILGPCCLEVLLWVRVGARGKMRVSTRGGRTWLTFTNSNYRVITNYSWQECIRTGDLSKSV